MAGTLSIIFLLANCLLCLSYGIRPAICRVIPTTKVVGCVFYNRRGWRLFQGSFYNRRGWRGIAIVVDGGNSVHYFPLGQLFALPILWNSTRDLPGDSHD